MRPRSLTLLCLSGRRPTSRAEPTVAAIFVPSMPFLLPAPVVYLLATGAKGGGLAEANMRADDAIRIEKMRAKRAGKAVDD